MREDIAMFILALEAGAAAIDQNHKLKTIFYSPSFITRPDEMISYALASVMLRDEAQKLREIYNTETHD